VRTKATCSTIDSRTNPSCRRSVDFTIATNITYSGRRATARRKRRHDATQSAARFGTRDGRLTADELLSSAHAQWITKRPDVIASSYCARAHRRSRRGTVFCCTAALVEPQLRSLAAPHRYQTQLLTVYSWWWREAIGSGERSWTVRSQPAAMSETQNAASHESRLHKQVLRILSSRCIGPTPRAKA